MQQLSIVIPVFNDAESLARLLPQLPQESEVIVVDGGSSDLQDARWPAAVRWLHTETPGRGAQLLAGAAAASRPWLWLLHADTRLTPAVVGQLGALQEPGWGRFDVALGGTSPWLKVIAQMMNWRSRWTGICTGDQGMFVHVALLQAVGGVPDQPLMEDIELSRRLRRLAPPRCLPGKLTTSARRWEQRGIVRTIGSMWWLRLRYWLGASPERLAARYYS